MKKKILFIFLFILLFCFLTGCKSNQQEVYYENLKDYVKLEDNIVQLLKVYEIEDNIRLYAAHTNGIYEYLLYYAPNKGKNLYQAISAKPYMKKDVLQLDIEVNDAVNESDINDEMLLYMILQKEPKEIKISVNDKLIDYDSVENVDLILK